MFRRDLLPDWELPFGAFETVLLPKFARRARVVNDMWTDHVQHRSFITATSSHVHNARVVGALARMSVPSPWIGK